MPLGAAPCKQLVPIVWGPSLVNYVSKVSGELCCTHRGKAPNKHGHVESSASKQAGADSQKGKRGIATVARTEGKQPLK